MRPLLQSVFCLAVFSQAAFAQIVVGSNVAPRPWVDTASGQVYIYAGDSLPAGTQIQSVSWYTSSFAAGGFLTPILFEQTNPGVFTVRGWGTGHVANSGINSFPFGLIAGIDVPMNSAFTFGFINSFVDGLGIQTSASTGVVDFDTPTTAGPGISGGSSTNRWIFTETYPGLEVGLGKRYGVPGTTYDFILNNHAAGGFSSDRTYSSTITTVPEPGSLSLLVFGALAVIMNRHRWVAIGRTSA